MFSSEDLEKIKKALAKLNGKDDKNNNPNQPGDGSKSPCVTLGPAQILIIAGFLTGVLEVVSVLVDKNQKIQIVLGGNLKLNTPLDDMMETIGKVPFEQVVKSILNSI